MERIVDTLHPVVTAAIRVEKKEGWETRTIHLRISLVEVERSSPVVQLVITAMLVPSEREEGAATTMEQVVVVDTMVVAGRTKVLEVEAPALSLKAISALESHSQLVTVGPSCPGPPLLFKV